MHQNETQFGRCLFICSSQATAGERLDVLSVAVWKMSSSRLSHSDATSLWWSTPPNTPSSGRAESLRFEISPYYQPAADGSRWVASAGDSLLFSFDYERISYTVIGFAIDRIVSEDTLVSVLRSLVPDDLSDILVISLESLPSRRADIMCFYAIADDEYPLYIEIAGDPRISQQQSCWMAHQFCRILNCIALVSPPIEPDNGNPYVAWQITRDGPQYRVILNADARDTEPSLLILDSRYAPIPLESSMQKVCQSKEGVK